MIVVTFVLLAVALLAKAAVLRLACHLLGVRPPGLGHAVVIVFLASIAGFIAAIVAEEHLQISQSSGPFLAQVLEGGIFLAVNMFVAALVYSLRLEAVSYRKGIALYWVQAAIWLAVALMIKGSIHLYELARFGADPASAS
jgi:hypothetical protein